LRILELLPYANAAVRGFPYRWADPSAALAYIASHRRNIELCFPRLSPVEQTDLLERHCESLGIGLCEIATTWWSSDARVRKLAQVEGIEHLVAALAKGRGVILVGGHFNDHRDCDPHLRYGSAAQCGSIDRRKNALLARLNVQGILPAWPSDCARPTYGP